MTADVLQAGFLQSADPGRVLGDANEQNSVLLRCFHPRLQCWDVMATIQPSSMGHWYVMTERERERERFE